MTEQSARHFASPCVSSKSRRTFSSMTPEQLLSMCLTAPYSPCRSLMKCSVPLGRVRMALRFIISEHTAASFGYFSARSSWYSREKSPRIAIPR